MVKKSCPFCGSSHIEFSLKTRGNRYYHASWYCKKCHCYGPRVLSEKILREDPRDRSNFENDTELREKALKKWNERVGEK